MRVPSHIDIPGNEKLDKYANRVTKNIPNSSINNIPTNDMTNYSLY